MQQQKSLGFLWSVLIGLSVFINIERFSGEKRKDHKKCVASRFWWYTLLACAPQWLPVSQQVSLIKVEYLARQV
jgi:hypothetical protein